MLVAAISAIVVGLSIVVVARMLDTPPGYDELLQYFAAEGIRQHGVPAILDGLYPRAQWYSRLLANVMDVLGNSLASARVVAFASWIATLAVVGAVAWRWFGLVPAALACATVAIDVSLLHSAGHVRFYSMHVLVVLLGTLAAIAAIVPLSTGIWRWLFVVCSAGLLFVALYLQVTTLIPLLALLLVLPVSLIAARFFRRETNDPAPAAAIVLCALCVLAIGVLLILQRSGIDAGGVGPAAGWVSDGARDTFTYIETYRSQLGMLAPAVVLLGLLALLKGTPAVRLLAVLTVLCFTLHSIAAAKAPRYISYLVPWLALVLAGGMHGLGAYLKERLTRSESCNVITGVFRDPAVIGLAVMGLLLLSPAAGAIRAAAVSQVPHWPEYRSEPDWLAAVVEAGVRAHDYDVVLTSSGIKAIWALGDYDFEVNRSVLLEVDFDGEFGADRRTGRKVVANADSVAEILEAARAPVFVADTYKWRTTWGVPPDVANRVEAVLIDISADPEVRIYVRAGPDAGGPD